MHVVNFQMGPYAVSDCDLREDKTTWRPLRLPKTPRSTGGKPVQVLAKRRHLVASSLRSTIARYGRWSASTSVRTPTKRMPSSSEPSPVGSGSGSWARSSAPPHALAVRRRAATSRGREARPEAGLPDAAFGVIADHLFAGLHVSTLVA